MNINNLQFMECATCAAKPGSPELCKACYNNRTLINHLFKVKGKMLCPCLNCGKDSTRGFCNNT